MSSKTLEIYHALFLEIKRKVEEMNLTLCWSVVHSDFEKSLYSSVMKIIPEINFKGCYFHFVKAIWAKIKKNELMKKSTIGTIHNVVYVLKKLPFLEIDLRKRCFGVFNVEVNKMFRKKEMSSDFIYKFNNFMKYYIKNWLTYEINWKYSSQIGFYPKYTNNVCEIYNKKINSLVGIKKPRISYLVPVINKLTTSDYEEYCANISSPKKIKKSNCLVEYGYENDDVMFEEFIIHKDLNILFSTKSLEDITKKLCGEYFDLN